VVFEPINIYSRCTTVYNWGYQSRYNNYSRLDVAVDNIVDSFNQRSMRKIERMIGRNNVEVELDTGNGYLMQGSDFYDLTKDLVEGTNTSNYSISKVRTSRGEAVVEAYHEYYDAWGNKDVVKHIYGLRDSYSGYEIVWFRVER
jgi:hypothetical protein